MQLKLSRGRWIEAALLLPTTAALGPALPFGIVVSVITLALGFAVALVGGTNAFAKELRSSAEVAALLAMMVSAAAALISLWLNILLGREWAFARPRRRYGLVGGLLAGMAAAGYWFTRLDVPPHNAGEQKALLVWIGLLLPPAILSLRYLWSLLSGPA
jgi:hypothetical protein